MQFKTTKWNGRQDRCSVHSVLVTPLDVPLHGAHAVGVPLHIGAMKRVETVDVGSHEGGASLDGITEKRRLRMVGRAQLRAVSIISNTGENSRELERVRFARGLFQNRAGIYTLDTNVNCSVCGILPLPLADQDMQQRSDGKWCPNGIL